MSGDSAAGTLVEIKIKQLERGGKKLSDEDGAKKLYDEVRHLRRADRPALRRGAAVDRQDHRSGGDARGDHHRAGGGVAESRCAEVQRLPS
jgi:hypothetical protein